MIKAVIFDFGGVILDMKPQLNKLVELFNLKDKAKFWEYLNLETVPLCRGAITNQEMWERINKHLNTNVPYKTLRKVWVEDYRKLTKLDRNVMKIIKQLRAQNYRLILLSNTIPIHTRINRKIGVFELFDESILSFRIRMTKDNPKMFQLAIKKAGVKPRECLFIDDVQKFVDVGRSAGMKAILFKSAAQLKRDLKKSGIKL